jgi:hypothetical protein
LQVWLVVGIFLLGTGAGALLTALGYVAQIKKLRAEIESREKEHAA